MPCRIGRNSRFHVAELFREQKPKVREIGVEAQEIVVFGGAEQVDAHAFQMQRYERLDQMAQRDRVIFAEFRFPNIKFAFDGCRVEPNQRSFSASPSASPKPAIVFFA